MTASPIADGWLALLQAAVKARGSIAAVAAEMGYSRTAVSLVLSGKYGGNTHVVAAAVTEHYAPERRLVCPHLGQEIHMAACRAHRTRPMPQSDPEELRHWRACHSCPLNPSTLKEGPADA